MMVLMKGAHSVLARSAPTGKTSTVRFSCRDRPLFCDEAMSAGAFLVAMAPAASDSWAWLSLSWTSRWFPVARAAANVFLGVHGVEGEQASGQSEGCDHVLGGGDFIAFLGDRQVAEDDLAVA